MLCRKLNLFAERIRCHRRQQVQGGEQSGSELHAGEAQATASQQIDESIERYLGNRSLKRGPARECCGEWQDRSA